MTPKEARALWASELESGKWQQGTGQLARETDTGTEYCCLGVACELAVREGIIDGYCALDGFLDPKVRNWLGLADEEGDYTPAEDLHGQSLVCDNDDGKPFKQIAATIRNEPEGLITT